MGNLFFLLILFGNLNNYSYLCTVGVKNDTGVL